jgi:hypothetical protein
VLAAQAARISVVEALLEHAGIPCAVEAETVSALDACVQVVAPPQAVTTSTEASLFLFAAKHFMQMFVYVRVKDAKHNKTNDTHRSTQLCAV